MRVVSLLPSATEIVWALGHGSELVGRSAECDFPTEVRQLPVVMAPRSLDRDGPSAEIDARVRRARSRGESLYALDLGSLRRLQPDLLLTQDLCGVCSVTEEEVRTACAAAGIAPNVLSLQPRTVHDVSESIRAVGRALGDPTAGERLAAEFELASVPSPASSPGRVAVVEWLDPPILAGLWTPELIAAAGGQPVGPPAGEVGQRTSWEALAEAHPDLVVLSPCSFDVGRTRRELSGSDLARQIGAVRPRLGTFVADEAFFSRPGPRLAAGVRLLRSLLAGAPAAAPMPVESWPPARLGA